MGDAPNHIPLEELLGDRAWIHALARALVRNTEDAEDAEQDAWVTALKRSPAKGPRLHAWWRTVVRSRAADARRADVRRRAREEASFTQRAVATPDELVERAELQGRVARIVTALPEPARITVLLRYFQALSVREIAEQLAVPETTVRSRLHRAHVALRTQLERDLGERGRLSLACLALPSSGAARSGATLSKTTTTALGATLMTTSQKISLGSTLLLVAMCGGAIGAWLVPQQEPLVPQERVEGLEAPMSAAPDGPTLRGAQAVDASAQDELALLRAQVADLQAQLKELEQKLDDHDPAAMDLVRRVLPRIVQERIRQGEMAAHASGRNFISAHAQVQVSARIDTDRDGTGEYGGFLEMSGAIPGRMEKALVPPVLARRFQRLNEHGEVEARGYLFRIYLPDRSGVGIGEPQEGFTRDSGVDPDLAETTWCCYAWPVEYGVTGQKTFFMNQSGDTLATDDTKYSGAGSGPRADAAFRDPFITALAAVGSRGQDGNEWKQVR